jgi:hypothetical protein
MYAYIQLYTHAHSDVKYQMALSFQPQARTLIKICRPVDFMFVDMHGCMYMVQSFKAVTYMCTHDLTVLSHIAARCARLVIFPVRHEQFDISMSTESL